MEKDRLSILEKVEQGEISIEEAELVLKQASEEAEPASVQEEKEEKVAEEAEPVSAQAKKEEELEKVAEEVEPASVQEEKEEKVAKEAEPAGAQEEKEEKVEKIAEEVEAASDQEESVERIPEEPEEGYVPTRRERKLALAERFQNWQPQMMVGSMEGENGSWQWPWQDKSWQWMWQNFDHPVYVSHSIDIGEVETRHAVSLQVVSYQGDLFIRGWDKPELKINGAVFDVRIGQDKSVVRVASSTGQVQIWIPDGIKHVEAMTKPGDMWTSNISADVDMYCQSGDLVCENIKGNVKARVNGGDVRLMGIEGSIYVNAIRGNSEVRNISSTDVTLKAVEGNIWLTLNSVSSGSFRCENDKGDINLLTNGELSCELLAEATKGGRISPSILPWQRLLERSESKIRGILKGGGASISLITQGGMIYIQEPLMSTFPMPSPG